MKPSKYSVDGKRIATKCQDIGHTAGDLIWWLDDGGIIQWRVFEGKKQSDVSSLDMDKRWRGRLDKNGNATLLPPLKLYTRFDAKEMMPVLPVGAMITLELLGAKSFLLDSRNGLARLRKRHEACSYGSMR
jgi:hypothetical protein